ncbi:MAG: hypothetical protein HY960_00570 [Ignavibacteriae bacterium]|nr:hypothetical protein [Ignavibacteriota bacterium]
MNRKRIIILCFGLCVLVFFSLNAQQDWLGSDSLYKESFTLSRHEFIVQLSRQFIVHGSEVVFLDSLKLVRGEDYQLDERFGIVKLNARDSSNQTKTHKIEILYKALPVSFKEKYRHRELVREVDSLKKVQSVVKKVEEPFSFNDVFGKSNLQKSGSIVRGLTIGSNRDLSLNSGFRLQMAGNLSDDIEVIAALTDENSPIQPEGTTQTLQEVDKVFVELRSKNVSATLGDFNFNVEGSEFASFTRKLQGGKLDANYRTGFSNGTILVAGATTRGKYHSISFIGLNSVQGPYRLQGKNGEQEIIVIAGSERVYINGEQMTRGELNDYTIEYGTGEVTFTTKRLISHASRITIDFEYNDRRYNRSLLATQVESKFLKDKYSIGFSFAKESDDHDSPVDLVFSETDKGVLEQAGGNPLSAYRSGIDSVGAGKGNYVRIDTFAHSANTQTNIPYLLYRFEPVDTLNALYLVTFSFVGSGNGDYEKVSVGNYNFVGISKGSYLPIRLLPLPEQHSMLDVSIKAKPVESVQFSGEFSHSVFDRNRFSSLDDDMNDGNAYKFLFEFQPKEILVGNTNFGSMAISLSERFIARNFNTLDRFNEIEFDRKWSSEGIGGEEKIREAKLNYRPAEQTMLLGSYGTMSKGDFSSKRFSAGVGLNGVKSPSVNYQVENVWSKNNFNSSNGWWLKQQGNSSYNFSDDVTASFKIEQENKQMKDNVSDSLQWGSYRLVDFGPSVSLKNLWRMSLKAALGWRVLDSLKSSSIIPTSNIFVQHYGWELTDWSSFTSKIDLTVRNQKEKLNNQTDDAFLIRWQTKYNPFERGIETDWFYEVASERTAKMERIFQRVAKGSGNYMYAGDVNQNRIVDEPDFQPTRFDGEYIAFLYPSQEYIPVTEVKSSVRFRGNGSRLFGKSNFLSALSNETYFRVEERSTESDKSVLYLMKLERFLNEQTTITGSNYFSNDFYLFENQSEFSVRLRYSQRKGLTQLATQNELTYTRERAIRLRFALLKEISNQTDYVVKDDNLLANQFSSRMRNITSTLLSSDFSYRPRQELELGMKFGVGSATNYGKDNADLNEQSIRIIYSFEEAGQMKVEFIREEAVLSNSLTFIPFELTSGRVAGKTWLLRLQSDYRLTQFLQANLHYEGRVEGEREPVHTAQAEVRAFF